MNGAARQQPDRLLARQCEVKSGRVLSGGSGDVDFRPDGRTQVPTALSWSEIIWIHGCP